MTNSFPKELVIEQNTICEVLQLAGAMNMFKEVADIKTSDQLNLPVPEAKFETVVVQPSDIQKKWSLHCRNVQLFVHGGTVDPSVDNMLKIYIRW